MTGQTRNPVPGSTFPDVLTCKTDKCIEKRRDAWTRFEPTLANNPEASPPAFVCPNKENKTTEGLCPKVAFRYPRSLRKPAEGSTFDPKVDMHFHQGIDLFGQDGRAEILAVMAGEVAHAIESYDKDWGGYGRAVVVKGDDKRYYLYAHCAWFKGKVGQVPGLRVEEGDAIAVVGRTGFESAEQAQQEIAHCEQVKAWADGGYQKKCPEPPALTLSSGKQRKWMAAHLHFEVSETKYPKAKSKERRLELPYSPEQRLDPLEVLKELGPWGTGAKRPELYFATGEGVTPRSAERLHLTIEGQKQGGYFPVGANGFWHGGVHLFGAEGREVFAPVAGTVVACRLDEDPSTPNQEFGHTNFVLVKHEIPKDVAARLGAPDFVEKETKKDAKDAGKSSDASETPGASVGRATGRRGKPGATNPPEYVVEIKRRLNACPVPGSDPKRPFYVASEADLADGTKVPDELLTAIENFQRQVAGFRNPDGIVSIETTGKTYGALLERTPTLRGVGDKSSETAAEPQASEPNREKDKEQPKDTETFFSLYMHIEPRPINAAAAKQVPWLKRVEMLPAAERQKGLPPEEERKQLEYRMKGDVGPDTVRGMENVPEDVAWVQKRLEHLGFYSSGGQPAGKLTPELIDAIDRFQEQHSMKNAKKNPVTGKRADSIISRNKTTYGYLLKSRKELNIDPPIEERFLEELRKRNDEGVSQVVSGLAVPIAAGEVLGTMGLGCSHGGNGLAPLIHWEIFSEKPLMKTWVQLKDPNDDLRVDATEPVLETIEQLVEADEDDTRLSLGEVAQYYNKGFGANLRYSQCLFPNEWSHAPSQVQAAFAALSYPLADFVAEQVKPYLFWDAVSGVVPTTRKVWHYNPVSFMSELLRAQGGLISDLYVTVMYQGQAISGLKVRVAASGFEKEVETKADGVAVVRGLSGGLYRVSASVERPSAASSEVYSAEVTVAIEPAEDQLVSLLLE